MSKKKRIAMPSMEQVAAEQQRNRYWEKYKKTLGSTVSTLIVIAAIAILISTLFLPVVQVVGSSMEPTLTDGDILVLIKTREYKRGEICCISWQNKKLLKRIIALPGDVVEIKESGDVYVNDRLVEEPYVSGKSLGNCDFEFPYQVPDGKLFVLGDHRTTSIDSRSKAIGCVGKDQVVGHTLFKVWPLF